MDGKEGNSRHLLSHSDLSRHNSEESESEGGLAKCGVNTEEAPCSSTVKNRCVDHPGTHGKMMKSRLSTPTEMQSIFLHIPPPLPLLLKAWIPSSVCFSMLGDPHKPLPFHSHGAACLSYLKLRCVQKVTARVKDNEPRIEGHEAEVEK